MFWAESSQCNSTLLNRVAGQVEVPAGQVNSRSNLPNLASNDLDPVLDPDQGFGHLAKKNLGTHKIYPWVFAQPGTGRHPVYWCRN